MKSVKVELTKYIKKSPCEIRWDGTKRSHFALIENLITDKQYRSSVVDEINRIKNVFQDNKIEDVVMNIDKSLPLDMNQHQLPESRKKLIIKFVTLRFKILKGMIE